MDVSCLYHLALKSMVHLIVLSSMIVNFSIKNIHFINNFYFYSISRGCQEGGTGNYDPKYRGLMKMFVLCPEYLVPTFYNRDLSVMIGLNCSLKIVPFCLLG